MTDNPEQNPIELPQPAAQEVSAEVLPVSVDSLLEKLEFESTAELETARQAIVAGLRDPETDPSAMRSAWGEYSDLLQQATDLSGDRSKAEIAAIIHRGLIFRDAGISLRYLEELDMAETNYSFREPLDEVRQSLTAEIHAVAETLDMSPEVLFYSLKRIISYDNREHLRDMIDEGDDFDDIIGSVYGMINDEGGDPDKVLANLGVFE